MRATAKPRPNYVVPALDRGLTVLELLSRDRHAGRVADLGRELSLPRASVFRILQTLPLRGFVEADSCGSSYALGPGVLRLGYPFLATRDVAQVARGRSRGAGETDGPVGPSGRARRH